MLLDVKAGVSSKLQYGALLLSIGRRCFLGIVELSKEGERDEEKVLLAGGGKRHQEHLHFPRPAIGSP